MSVVSTSRIIEPGRVYRHFKGNYYLVTGISEHTETGEQMVEYTALYGNNKKYCRPYNMFIEDTSEYNKNNPTDQFNRFVRMSLPNVVKEES